MAAEKKTAADKTTAARERKREKGRALLTAVLVLLPILCGVFLVESLSVLLQQGYFKYRKRKGERVRIFRATPLHDNFRRLDSELDPTSRYIFRGWPKRQFHESKITIRFWIFTIILAALTIITLKIR